MSDQPETQALSFNGKYRPMYRLKPTDRWNCVARAYETASQAIAVADTIIEALTRPAHVLEEEMHPLGNPDDWRREKDAELAAERERVFGSTRSGIIYLGGGKTVAVEPRHRRRA